MAEERHVFTKDTAKRLCDRVASICSKPDCKAPTKGPHSDGESAINVGMACHIHAASPGGPRYDVNQTEEDRRSIHNGIWLCRTCGTLIDTDEDRFPAPLLRAWRAEAELAAFKTIGKPAAAFGAPTDATGGVRMSADAVEYMRFLMDDFIENNFRDHRNRWFGLKSHDEPIPNELRALGLVQIQGMRNDPRLSLTDAGVAWIMRMRQL